MNWKETLGAIAPTLATALGGPLAGAATKFLANELLGDESASIEDIEQTILGASSQDLAKMKELDLEFKLGMKKLDIDVFALEVKDRDSARTNHKLSNTPTVLVYMLTVLIALVTYLLFNAVVPESNENNLYMLLGALTTAWVQSISYWTGTTRSSSEKTRLLK
jgi:hypothetical protein